MEDFVPTFFDPFDLNQIDITQLNYDSSTDSYYNGNQLYVPTPEQSQQVQTLLDQEINPLNALQQVISQEQENHTVEDPADLMPNQIFEVLDDDCIFFNDSSFFAPTVASFQQCLRKNIQGYCLIPAQFAARLRSRKGNHSKPTPALFLPPSMIPDHLRAKFE